MSGRLSSSAAGAHPGRQRERLDDLPADAEKIRIVLEGLRGESTELCNKRFDTELALYKPVTHDNLLR